MQTIKLYLFNEKYLSKRKFKIIIVVNSKLRIGIIIVKNFSIYIACYHIKIDANRAVS